MRITGGELAGRKILPPLSLTTRPMLDRIRQALFNILNHHDWGAIGDVFAGSPVLDAFCGTGALGFEALSHGAGQATLFDRDTQALQVARQNAAALGLQSRCTVMALDTLNPPPAPAPCKLVFLAPPYNKGLIPPALTALDAQGWLAAQVLVLAETQRRETLPVPAGFTTVLHRAYGDTALHFLQRK